MASKSGMSIRQYAAYRRARGLPGHSRSTVERALREGRIERNADGRIDPTVADQQWTERTDALKQSRTKHRTGDGSSETAARTPERRRPADTPSGPSPSVPSLAQSRAIREAYRAKLARIEYEEKAGNLVSLAEVKATSFRQARVVRDRLLAVSDRLSAPLAAETDPRKVMQMLEEEILQALEELSHVR